LVASIKHSRRIVVSWTS